MPLEALLHPHRRARGQVFHPIQSLNGLFAKMVAVSLFLSINCFAYLSFLAAKMGLSL
jgi:hypothetical protein